MTSDFECGECGAVFDTQPERDGHLSGHDRRLDEGELIEELRRLASELGKNPSSEEMDKHGKYSVTPYQREFGTWGAAKRAAGFEPGCELQTENLLEELDRLKTKLGRPPTTRDMDAQGEFSSQAYTKRFGTWNSALSEADIDPFQHEKLEVDDLLDDLRRVSKRVGCSPTISQYRLHGKFSHITYGERFGSWPTALEEAGLEPTGYTQTGEEHPLWEGGPDQAYGEGWNEQKREKIRRKYNRTCVGCGLRGERHLELYNERLHVHHIRPARLVDSDEERNAPRNLIPFCKRCHKRWEGIPLQPQTESKQGDTE